MNLRLRFYRRLMKRAFAVFAEKAEPGKTSALRELRSRSPETERSRLVWFHAASAGEIESLAPVALAWASAGNSVVLSVFSRSGIPQMEKLADKIQKTTGSAPLRGFSPIEGAWSTALSNVRPVAFVTVKYEAWPDLWASLSENKIPLYVIGAKARSSFRWIKRVLGWLGSELPDLNFFTVQDSEAEPLKNLFPAAGVQCLGEPRWDQVASRAQQSSARANELLKIFAGLPRPWGILAQIWNSDLTVWNAALSSVRGTLWVVPHRLEKRDNDKLIDEIRRHGLSVLSSRDSPGELGSETPRVVFVGEMGVLAELYSAMDWSYVGGGFGQGVHSTIEPAIHGLPLSIGPEGASKFPEIQQLQDSGQLTIIRDAADVGAWLVSAQAVSFEDKRRWKGESEARLGASARIVSALDAGLSAPEHHANL